MGTVEHVGETFRSLESRMYDHKKKPHERNRDGKFYGRQDVFIHLVAEFDNRPDALKLEDLLKQQYGLKRDEHERNIKACLNGGKTAGSKEKLCPYCSKILKGNAAYGMHTKACKQKMTKYESTNT
jgi:hypothetical protein